MDHMLQVTHVFVETLPSLKRALHTWKWMVGSWKITFLLGWPAFRGYVSVRECIRLKMESSNVADFVKSEQKAGDLGWRVLLFSFLLLCFYWFPWIYHDRSIHSQHILAHISNDIRGTIPCFLASEFVTLWASEITGRAPPSIMVFASWSRNLI